MVNNKLNKSNKSNSKNKITSITLVTSNLNKLREFKAILEPKIKVEHIALEFPELRHDDSRKIAEMSAEMISEKLKKAVGWKAKVNLREGLKRTIEYYKSSQ